MVLGVFKMNNLLCWLFGHKFLKIPKSIDYSTNPWLMVRHKRAKYCKCCGAINHKGVVYD